MHSLRYYLVPKQPIFKNIPPNSSPLSLHLLGVLSASSCMPDSIGFNLRSYSLLCHYNGSFTEAESCLGLSCFHYIPSAWNTRSAQSIFPEGITNCKLIFYSHWLVFFTTAQVWGLVLLSGPKHKGLIAGLIH